MPGYGDDAGLGAYAAATGRTIAVSGTVTKASLRQVGSVFVDGSYEARWPGVPTGGVAQERSWPRTGATDRYGNPIDTAAIPVAVVNASYEAALLELASPGSLSAFGSDASRVKSMKAGSVSLEYADVSGPAVAGMTPVSTLIEGMLAGLFSPVLPGMLVV